LNKAMMVSTKGVDSAEEKYRRWLDIPGWLIVTCQRSEDDILYREDYAACCCVIQNLMLYLWSNGVGTKWSTGPVTQDDRCYDITWIDRKSENIIGLIWYGYPAETPKTLRKNLEQVLIELP
jgi:nitroreductase